MCTRGDHPHSLWGIVGVAVRDDEGILPIESIVDVNKTLAPELPWLPATRRTWRGTNVPMQVQAGARMPINIVKTKQKPIESVLDQIRGNKDRARIE